MPILFIQKNGDKKKVDYTNRNLNLLGHAQLEEVPTGSRCGGHGICGGDLIRIADETMREILSPITEDERKRLTQSQLDAGIRLACQCYPNLDEFELTVEVL